jgi:tetratricopeptide (TPR) repeat protein
MDLWRWFSQECERLEESGHAAAAETLTSLVEAMTEADHDRVDAVFPEALQIARALGNPWLEIFARHWNLQSRVFGRLHGTSALGEAVALVELAHRPGTHDCPQAVCAVQDLAACYRNVDGPGYAEERLEVTRETLARIDPSWPCYRCVGSQHAEALEDLGRRDDAARFLADNRARALAARDELGDRATDTEILIRMGRADEAMALIDGWDPTGKADRDAVAIQRARTLALLGRFDDAMASLPALGEIEATPGQYERWVDGAARLIAAGRMPNDAAWGRTVRRFVARARRDGAQFPAFTLAARGVEFAIDRGASAVAARDLEVLRRIQRERRFPERAQPVIDRLAEQLAARIAPAPPPDAGFADEAAVLAALEAGAAGDPEARLAALESARARWPDAGRVALALAQTLLGLGFDEDAESVLRAHLARHPQEFAAASLLGELLLRARRDAELEALAAPMLDGPAPSDGHFLLGRLAFARRRLARAVEHFAHVLEHHPDAITTRAMWANAARQLGDFPAMLARLDELVERIPEEQSLHWDRMVAATLTGDWDKVRASAAAVGMELEGTGPIDLPGPLCRIRFQDDRHGSPDRWAVRNGPVTARIIEPVPEPAPQHYDAIVVFDAAPLDVPPDDDDDDDDDDSPASEDGEERPATFAAVAVLRPGGYRTFIIDGPHPGEAAWQQLVDRLGDLGCRVRVQSGEHYRLLAGQAELPGIYALVSIPSATAPADVHAALAAQANDHAFPLTWADLAAAADDAAAAAAHRARLERYEGGDDDPDPDPDPDPA